MASVWLDEAIGAEGTPASPPLDGSIVADICIVGGGYTGLWTALELKERDPGLDIVLIEKDVCGAGGSGANAGFALSAWLQFPLFQKLYGTSEALRLCRAADDDLVDIGRFCDARGIDAQYHRHGAIWGATCIAQAGHWDAMLDELARHQVHHFKRLTGNEITAMTGTRAYVAGALDTSAAMIHPGFLVRGLRRVALERGIKIYEQTPMTRLGRTRPPTVTTPSGTITAGKVILALYAWSLGVPELRPGIMVICTDAAMTVPIPEELEKIGWTSGVGLTDSRIFVEAQRPTQNGQVMWTKAGGAMPFGAQVDRCAARPSRPVSVLRDILRVPFPELADAPLKGSWTGPIDRTRNGLPMFGALPSCHDILYGFGYSGAGIVLSKLGGHILSSLALEADDAWSNGGMVRPVDRGFPPEPIRYIGAHMVHRAIQRKDRLDHEGRAVGPVTRTLLKFKPQSYKPT